MSWDKNRDYYWFDSTGMEKAAAAAKYLDESPNSEKAFKLSVMKEETQ